VLKYSDIYKPGFPADTKCLPGLQFHIRDMHVK